MPSVDRNWVEAVAQSLGYQSPTEIPGITANSKAVKPGWVFVAVKGSKVDGHSFIPDAIAAGAGLLIVETEFPGDERVRGVYQGVPYLRVANSRLALAHLLWANYGYPTDKFNLVGITGTDGKTSSAQLMLSGLQACGHITGSVGTITYDIDKAKELSSLTTPGPEILAPLFKRMVDAGVQTAVMEVSSHGLALNRVYGCNFRCVVFTNITRDHLDFHGSLEEYANAKLLLFSEVIANNPDTLGAVVNQDDPLYQRIVDVCPVPVVGFSLNPDSAAAIAPIEVHYGLDGIKGTLRTPWGNVSIDSKLIGKNNLKNIMTAIGVGGVLGHDITRFTAGVCQLDRIPGRLEAVSGKRNVNVFVDFAHTPDAITGVLSILKELAPNHPITAVFGAGGSRDAGKRPLMGRAAALLASKVVVTSDNPRAEDAKAIAAQIVAGIDELKEQGIATGEVIVETDRRLAIKLAIETAEDGEVIVILGKGHEATQDFGTRVIHFSDVEVAKEYLDS